MDSGSRRSLLTVGSPFGGKATHVHPQSQPYAHTATMFQPSSGHSPAMVSPSAAKFTIPAPRPLVAAAEPPQLERQSLTCADRLTADGIQPSDRMYGAASSHTCSRSSMGGAPSGSWCFPPVRAGDGWCGGGGPQLHHSEFRCIAGICRSTCCCRHHRRRRRLCATAATSAAAATAASGISEGDGVTMAIRNLWNGATVTSSRLGRINSCSIRSSNSDRSIRSSKNEDSSDVGTAAAGRMTPPAAASPSSESLKPSLRTGGRSGDGRHISPSPHTGGANEVTSPDVMTISRSESASGSGSGSGSEGGIGTMRQVRADHGLPDTPPASGISTPYVMHGSTPTGGTAGIRTPRSRPDQKGGKDGLDSLDPEVQVRQGDMYGRPRKRPALGPEAAAALARTATAVTASRRRWVSDDGSGSSSSSKTIGSASELPARPAAVMRAIKTCATATELQRLYRLAQPPAVVDLAMPDGTATSVKSTQPAVSTELASATAGSMPVEQDGGGGAATVAGGVLNDLHLVAMLTHLAQLAAAEMPLSSPRQRFGGGHRAGAGVVAADSAVLDVTAFGWEVAMAIGVRLAMGSEVLSQPRAASNSLWAAAKLGLTLRAAWWEALATPLLRSQNSKAAADDDWMPPLPMTGRDLCNAVYALGVATAAATGSGGGGGDLNRSDGDGRAVSGAARRFEGRLRAVGLELLEACTASRLKGCKAQELSSLLYGAGLLGLQPSATWLEDCYSPALLAVIPFAGPQVVANVLGALQRFEAPPPLELTTVLLQVSKAMLTCTAAATSAAATSGAAAATSGAATAPSHHSHYQQTHPTQQELSRQQHQQLGPSALTCALQSSPPMAVGLQEQQRQPQQWNHLSLPPDMMVTVIWSVGRLYDRGALRNLNADPNLAGLRHSSAATASTTTAAAADNSAEGLSNSWLSAAVGASSRVLLRQLAAAAAENRQEPPRSGERRREVTPPLAPRSLAALANALALLQVAPAGSADDVHSDVWRLLYTAALRLCREPLHGTTVVGSSSRSSVSSGDSYAWWDPRDVFSLLSAAVTALDLASENSTPFSETTTQVQLSNSQQHQQSQSQRHAGQSQLQTQGSSAAVAAAALSFVSARPPAELVEALLLRLLPTLLPVQLEPATVGASAVERNTNALKSPYVSDYSIWATSAGAAGSEAAAVANRPGGSGGGGGSCSDSVLVGCVWALGKLRYRPSQDILAALAIAARGRVARLPPPSLAQLLWSFAILQQLSPPQGHQQSSILTLAPGLQRRIRSTLERTCGGGAPPAAVAVMPPGQGAKDAVPPLPPRTVVQLVSSLRRLRISMPPALTYRMTSALVRPAVQQLSQDLQLQQRRILTIRADDCGGGSGGGENGSRVSTSSLPMTEAPKLCESVRLLGALASAAASLCDSVAEWRERNTTRGDGGSGDGGSISGSSESRTSSLSRSGRRLPRGRRSSETGFPAPPVDLRRTGLRLALWEAGWLAVRTASSGIKDEQDLQGHEHQVQRLLSPFSPPPIPLRDWCSYLAGLRRLGFRPPLDLSTALLEYLALPGPLAQLQTCSVREIVTLACELSYIAARRPQWRLPYGAAKLRLLRRQVRAAPHGSSLPAAHCQVAGQLPVNEDAAGGGLRARGLAAEVYVRNGGSGGGGTSADIGFGGQPRQRHRRIDWLVQSKVGPALLAAAQRMGEGSGSGGDTAARPPIVSARQAATLLRALRRLRLQLPAPVLAALMRASAGGSGAIGGTPSPDLTDTVRMAVAVAAAMPVLPTTTSNLQAEARGTGSAVNSPVPPMAVESRTESAAEAEAEAGAIKSTSNDALAAVEVADSRMSVMAADWLTHIAARTEAHLLAAPPIVLLEVLLPLVAELVEAARRADWMQDVIQSRIVPATFAACIRTLLRGGGAPLLFISRLLDALLALTVSRPPVRRRSAAAGGATSNGARIRGLRKRTRFAPSQPTKGRPPPLDVRLPDDLWIAVYRASYRQMATALPLAAASVAATVTATGTSTSATSSIGSGAAVAALAAEAAAGSDRVAMTSSDVNAAAAASAPSPSRIIASGNACVGVLAHGDGAPQGPCGPRRRGASEVAVQPLEGRKPRVELLDRGGRTAPVCTAASTVLGSQVIVLAYSLARHPPLRPPPDRWMRLMLLAVEADLASLGAWECANLCVSLVRLGCVPGASWLDRFGLQVELIRALTEKTEHTLLSRAWLGLRQLRDRQNHQSQQKQQQLNEQLLAPGDCGAPLTDKESD